MKLLKSGLWPVMLTPFKENKSIDWSSLQKLTNWYIENGAAGLFACCMSSEMFDLDDNERFELVAKTVEFAGSRCQVVATATFSRSVPENIAMIRRMADTGADALVINTAYVADEEDDDSVLRRNLLRIIAETAPIPLGLYECPIPYKRLISLKDLQMVTDSGRFLYLKDTCCNLELMKKRVAVSRGSSLKLFNANTPTSLKSLQLGMHGMSTIAGNVYPQLFATVFEQLATAPEATSDLHRQLTRIDPVVRVNYPLNAKRLLKKQGIIRHDTCRVKTLAQTDDHQELLAVLEEFLAANGLREVVLCLCQSRGPE